MPEFIKNVIYGLKKQYGEPADFYFQSDPVTNYDTGQKTQIINKVHVPKIIRLPDDVRRIEFLRNLQSDFKFGGFYDKSRKDFIIDKIDLKGNTPSLIDYIICKNKRYNIKDMQIYDEAYYLVTEQIATQVRTVIENIFETVYFSEEMDYES